MSTNRDDFLLRFAIEEIRQYLDKQGRLRPGDPLHIAFSDLQELATPVGHFEEQIKNLEAELEDAWTNLNYWTDKHDQLEKENEELTEETQELRVSSDHWMRLCEENIAKRQKLEQKNKRLCEQIGSLHKKNNEYEEEILDLKSEIEERNSYED